MRLTLVCLAALLTFACSDADSLGDQPPVEVPITGNPTWENGIAELVDLKCAWCHAVPKPDIAPSDITPDLDLTQYATQIENGTVIRGGDSIGRWMADGILEHPVDLYVDITQFPDETILAVRQMPLDYATQLTQSEITALLAWSANGSPLREGEVYVGDPIAGEISYNNHCAVCHAVDGQGVNAFINGQPDPNRWYGTPIRPGTGTPAKVKSMWLTKVVPLEFRALEPVSDEEANNIAVYLDQLTSGQ